MSTPLPAVRVICCLVAVLAGGFCASSTQAAEPYWPETAVIIGEIRQPLVAWEHPLIKDAWQTIVNSPGYQVEQSAPALERLRQGQQFLEKALGTTWYEGLNKLSAGGMRFALIPSPGKQPVLQAVFSTADAETVQNFVAGLHAELDRQRVANPKVPVVQSAKYNELTAYQLGEAYYAVAGRHLLFANKGDGLKWLIEHPVPEPAAGAEDTEPLPPGAHIEFRLDALRKAGTPQFTLPAANAGQVLAVGGYLDLAQRAKTLTADLVFLPKSIALEVAVDAGGEGMPAALQPFFASPHGVAAPLLKVPAMVYSATLYRDFAALWEQKTALISAPQIAQVEQENEQQAKKSGIGGLDILRSMGPHLRLVVARQDECVYRQRPAERLPASAFVVDVPDEAQFRAKILDPLNKLVRSPLGLALGFVKTGNYKEAAYTAFRVREMVEEAPREDDFRFSLNPSMTLTRGHFIIGSTEEIVRQVIDELDRQAALTQTSPAETLLSDHQTLSLPELGRLAQEFKDRTLRSAILERGLTVEEGERELETITDLLSRLGSFNAETHLEASRAMFRLSLGEE